MKSDLAREIPVSHPLGPAEKNEIHAVQIPDTGGVDLPRVDEVDSNGIVADFVFQLGKRHNLPCG